MITVCQRQSDIPGLNASLFMCVSEISVLVHGFKTYVERGACSWPKTKGSTQNCRHYSGDIKQVPFSEPTRIVRHRTKFGRHSNVVRGLCTLLYRQKLLLYETSRRWHVPASIAPFTTGIFGSYKGSCLQAIRARPDDDTKVLSRTL